VAGLILFLDDDNDLREVATDLFGLLGHTALGVASYDELVSLGERALKARVAVLDINLGADRPSGIDAYRWLRDQGFEGAVVFLTGHAPNHPLVAEAVRIGRARVMQKPIHLDALQELVSDSQASG
jgi:FixJ family two-component response regulator